MTESRRELQSAHYNKRTLAFVGIDRQDAFGRRVFIFEISGIPQLIGQIAMTIPTLTGQGKRHCRELGRYAADHKISRISFHLCVGRPHVLTFPSCFPK